MFARQRRDDIVVVSVAIPSILMRWTRVIAPHRIVAAYLLDGTPRRHGFFIMRIIVDRRHPLLSLLVVLLMLLLLTLALLPFVTLPSQTRRRQRQRERLVLLRDGIRQLSQ